MKMKVKKNVESIVQVIEKWSGARSVILQHFVEKDIYDPNFSITLDVFCDDDIPDANERRTLFPEAVYFDSSHINEKDRFLMNDLPVRISYKDCHRVEKALAAVDGDGWMHMERGTYLFYRISTGTIVWHRDKWSHEILEKLDKLPEMFWIVWKDSCVRRIDHMLSDMKAAVLKDDALYFQISLAGFLKITAEFLFALNHFFEPGPRDIATSLTLLETLPDGFEANWKSLLRGDGELQPERKLEIAEILAKSLISLTVH